MHNKNAQGIAFSSHRHTLCDELKFMSEFPA